MLLAVQNAVGPQPVLECDNDFPSEEPGPEAPSSRAWHDLATNSGDRVARTPTVRPLPAGACSVVSDSVTQLQHQLRQHPAGLHDSIVNNSNNSLAAHDASCKFAATVGLQKLKHRQ